MVLHVCLEVPTLLMWNLCSAGSIYYVVISTGPLSGLRVKIPIAGLLLISAEEGGWEKTVRLGEGWSINISMQPLQAMHSPGLPWDNGVKFTVGSLDWYIGQYICRVWAIVDCYISQQSVDRDQLLGQVLVLTLKTHLIEYQSHVKYQSYVKYCYNLLVKCVTCNLAIESSGFLFKRQC